MQRLFSPWRTPYIGRDKEADKAKGCVFCHALTQPDSPENLIVFRGQSAFVILNRYPYTSGHLMVLPFTHAARLDEIDAGANIGSAAGAGIEEHLHLHVVPRWAGDMNFMPAVGQTRVLPEALEETWQRVYAAWQAKI